MINTTLNWVTVCEPYQKNTTLLDLKTEITFLTMEFGIRRTVQIFALLLHQLAYVSRDSRLHIPLFGITAEPIIMPTVPIIFGSLRTIHTLL